MTASHSAINSEAWEAGADAGAEVEASAVNNNNTLVRQFTLNTYIETLADLCMISADPGFPQSWPKIALCSPTARQQH